MKSVFSKFIIGVVVVFMFLTGCGKKDASVGVPANNHGQNAVSKNVGVDAENNDEGEVNNVDKFLNLLLETNKKSKFRFTGSSQGEFRAVLTYETYKKDIVNPYNKGKNIYAINRSKYIIEDDKSYWEDCSVSFATISQEWLKKLDTKKVVFGCNEKNKGMVMALGFGDGFYLYQIDEKGNKIHEKTYFLPEEKEQK